MAANLAAARFAASATTYPSWGKFMWSIKAFFRRRANAKRLQTGNRNEWICVTFNLPSGLAFGTHQERELIHTFSDGLATAIEHSGDGTFDGDEFGAGECSLFAYGKDADRLFAVMRPLLDSWDMMRGGYIVKRYGSPHAERIQF